MKKTKQPDTIEVVAPKKICLTHGKLAIVDVEDFDWLSQWHWFYKPGGYAVRNQYLGTTGTPKVKRYKRIYMSREILKAPVGLVVDHINHDTLDNRKVNLRLATHRENSINSSIRKHSSRYKGVSWKKQYKKWASNIVVYKKQISLGYFDNEEEAAKIYNEAAKKYFGEFAFVNLLIYENE